METYVLIPQELSLVVNTFIENDKVISVWTSATIEKGKLFYPFQGTIRHDKIHIGKPLKNDDIRHGFGLYDEMAMVLGQKVRHCNWIRFLRISESYNSNVNVICTKLKGEPIFEAIKPIMNNQELVVFCLPQKPEEYLFTEIRSTLHRNTIDAILLDTPLDFSMSLIHRKVLPISPVSSNEDEHKCSLLYYTSKSLSSQSPNKKAIFTDSSPSYKSETTPAAFALTTPSKTKRFMRGERSLLYCNVCGKLFDRPSLLKRHMRTHTGEKPHVCAVCGKGFSTSSSLNTHRRIHSGEKPHECQVCGKKFTASSNLYYHRMTHIKEKPHKCNLCSKSFPTPGDLKSHMYIHSGSWPYKCHICYRGFSKQTNLRNHLFLHTGDKPHICELCNKKFALACNLRAHIKTHEGELKDECTQCGKIYFNTSNCTTTTPTPLPTTTATTNGLCSKCDNSKCSIDSPQTGFACNDDI